MASKQDKAKEQLAAKARQAICAEALRDAKVEALMAGVSRTEIKEIVIKVCNRQGRL